MLNSIKTASIALAAGTLTLSMPVAAAPAVHHTAPMTASYVDHAPAWGETTFDHKRKYKKRHRHGYGRYDRYDDDRYDRYDDRDDRYYRRAGRNYDEPIYRDTRIWRGRDGRYHCRKEDGTTGLLIGAGVGALIGNEVAGRGDRTLGAILGAAGGAILGRSIDRSNSRCR